MTRVRVLFNFTSETDCELTIHENEELTITDKSVGEGWWNARNASGQCGMIPMSYVEEIREEEYQEVPSDESWSDDEGKDKTITRGEEITSQENHSVSSSAVSDSRGKESISDGQVSESKHATEYNG